MGKRKLKVTVMMDSACVPSESPDFMSDSLAPSTENDVVKTLRTLGHDVDILSVDAAVEPLVRHLAERKPDLVFNLTEVFRGNRTLDKNVAGLLEMLDVPFTGTGSAGLMLCRNKGLCKHLLGSRKVRVPGFAVFVPGKPVRRMPKSFRYPQVVKPLYEDGSEGISNASLVKDTNDLAQRVAMVHERWKQPAIAEEYVDGVELYVSVLGNSRLTVLPARQLYFGKADDGGPVLATYRVKWNKAYQERWNISFGFSDLPTDLARSVGRVCRRAYRMLQIKDYGRIDLRVTPENHIVLIEVNPNPDIARGEEVAESAEKAGIPYTRLIDRIVRSALRRYGRDA